MKKTLYLLLLLAFPFGAFSQAITFSPNNAFDQCPNQPLQYTVNNSVTNACIFDWTVTNGTITGGSQNGNVSTFSGGTLVTITWLNTTQSGLISVVARNCNPAGGNTSSAPPISYAIRSINGVDPGSITGASTVTVNTTTNQVYSIPQINFPNIGSAEIAPKEVNSYEWEIPAGWTVVSGGTTKSITVKPDNCSGGNIRVRGKSTTCTNGPFFSNFSTVTAITRTVPTPGAITGPSGVDCTDTSAKSYSIAAVSGATSFVWTLPSNWGGSSTTTSLTATPSGSNGGTLSVKAIGCGIQSAPSNLTIALSPLSLSISGSGAVCYNPGKTFTVNNVPTTGSSTTWQVSPSNLFNSASGSGISATLNDITAYNYGSATLTFNVVHAACNINASISKSIWVGFPSPPGPVSGETAPSVGGIYQYVSSSPAQGQAYYNWTLPYYGNPLWSQSGGNINGIIDTLVPNLIVGSSSGWVQAFGVNECGNGAVSKLRVFPVAGGGGGQQQRIAVYPNPTSNSLTIESTTTDLTIFETESNDKPKIKKNEEHFTAKLLDQFSVELRAGQSKNGKVTFDIQSLQDGLYYLHVQNGQELITKQIQIKK